MEFKGEKYISIKQFYDFVKKLAKCDIKMSDRLKCVQRSEKNKQIIFLKFGIVSNFYCV